MQRWLKMSKYLSEFGWDPVIFTPENPSFGSVDQALEKEVSPDIEVIRFPIWEPYQMFNKLKGRKSKNLNAADISIKKPDNFLDKMLLWIRANFFIPDPRIFWVRSSVKFLSEVLESNNITAVITTGPPHSIHLIGRKLKKKTGILWLADFRDPWTQWDLYEEFPMLNWVRKRHEKMEKKVLQGADKVLTINNYYKNEFQRLGGLDVEVISNGYDEDDFVHYEQKRPDKFTIRHIGVLDEMRNPQPFLEALSNFVERLNRNEVKVELIGNVANKYINFIASSKILKEVVRYSGYKPHDEIIKIYGETSVLLLVLTTSRHAAGNTTGKIYEYLASGVRILALGPPEGEVAHILADTTAGEVTDHNNQAQILELLEKYYREYQEGRKHKNKNIYNYSRRSQAHKVAKILDEL